MEDTTRNVSVQEYLRFELNRAVNGNEISSLPFHKSSTREERDELGSSALEISMDWKRILSPMLSYKLIQEALVLTHRESKEKKCEFKSTLTTEMKQMFVDILQEMKALAEPVQRRLKQRHEPWVDLFREQVDIAPGKGTPRRVVDVQELAEILTLTNQIKTTGNDSFKEHDYAQAVTRYVQVANVLKDIRAVRPEENAMIDEVRLKATRNLTLAALKNWEWSRARRACDTVLEETTNETMDHIVYLRRAEANKQLGRFEPAFADIAAVLSDSNLNTKGREARKARSLRHEMRKIEKQSNDDLRDPLAKGLSASNIFSEHRVSSPEKNPDDDDAFNQMPHIQRLRATMRAKGIRAKNEVQDQSSDSANLDYNGLSTPQEGKEFALELQDVKEIQTKQLNLFNAPEVRQKLDEIRLAADMEQIRFMHRLKPFKVDVQRELLKEYNFPETETGLAAMERAIAAHMADCKEVAMCAKDLMLLIMGDIW